MLETLFGIQVGITLSDLGVLTALTTVLVEVLKTILPKKFPTKALTVIIGLTLTLVLVILGFGAGVTNIVIGTLAGLVVSFISMNGFDALKDIWERFTVKGITKQLIENHDDEEDVKTMEYSEGENEVLEEDEIEGEG